MYEEYYITLPGGFQLPIALIKETVTVSQIQTTALDPQIIGPRLESFGRRYILDQMISGRIEAEQPDRMEENGLLVLEGEYLCTEMIGRLRQEKIGE